MKKFTAILGAALMTATVGLVTVAGTQDARADFRCTGTISNRTISDNVHVPSGSTCSLNNVRVDGNVRTGKNARLTITGGHVDGNVEGYNHRSLVVQRARIDGNVISDRGQSALIRQNTVDGNIEMFSNRQTLRIFRNTVDGNIVCKSNSGPITGLLNRVDGDQEEQCRNLKQRTEIGSANRGTLRPASDGWIYIYGHLKIYDTYGNYTALTNQRITIQTRAPGSSTWNTVRVTGKTTGTGYYIGAIRPQKSYDVRAVFASPYSSITSAYRGVGPIG